MGLVTRARAAGDYVTGTPSRFLLLASATCWALGCAQDDAGASSTQLELTVHSEAGWALTQFELVADDRDGLVPSTPAPLGETEVVTLVLSDAHADAPLELQVWGRADGERVAFGTVEATPRKGRITRAEVKLMPLACEVDCLDAGVPADSAIGSESDAGPAIPDATTQEPPVCTNCGPCDDGVCESPPAPAECYAPTGTCNEDGGTCDYAYENGASCDDGDPCTVDDGCHEGACSGAAVRCDAPPAAACLDGDTLEQFASEGSCDADTGACVYAPMEVACTYGCQNAACACRPGQFDIVTVDDETDGTLASSAIAVDASGRVHVFYGAASDTQLRYAYKPRDGAWSAPEPVASGNYARSHLSIAVDPDGVVHVVYEQPSSPRVLYASRATSGTWTAGELSGSARSPAIVTDAEGTLHVSYYDVARGDLTYARKTSSGQWNHMIADPGTAASGVVGEWSSIGLDGQGGVHIAYYDLGTHDLKYAYRQRGGSFSTQRVGYAGNLGLWAAVAADRDGTVHIVYEEPTATALVHVFGPAGGTLVPETVESEGATGRYPGIGIDSAGGVHVVYRKDTRELRYGYKPRGGSFSLGTIDSQGLGFLRASLAIDSANGVHVAYYDDANDLLEYAHKPVCAP